MRRLEKPNFDAVEVFRLCNSRVGDIDLKFRLQAVEASVLTAAQQYEVKAATETLHEFIPDDISELVSNEELTKIYKNRLVPKKSPGRKIYDALLMSPKNERCPLCGHQRVATLDHHLPKAHYPILSVVPVNLVPMCTHCNNLKGDSISELAEEQALHPYYDDFEADGWLEATVGMTRPAHVLFHICPPVSWAAVKAKRLERHFRTFQLARLYGSNAADEIVALTYILQLISDKRGKDAVVDELNTRARSYEQVSLNSWQAAMYRALARCDWYCSGGFRS